MTTPFERLRAIVGMRSFLLSKLDSEIETAYADGPSLVQLQKLTKDAASLMPSVESLVAAARSSVTVKEYLLQTYKSFDVISASVNKPRVLDGLKLGIVTVEKWHLMAAHSLGPFNKAELNLQLRLSMIMRHCPSAGELESELIYIRPICEWIGTDYSHTVRPDWLRD